MLPCISRTAYVFLALVAGNQRGFAVAAGGIVLAADVGAVGANIAWLGGSAGSASALALLLAFNVVVLILVGALASSAIKEFLWGATGAGSVRSPLDSLGEECAGSALLLRLANFASGMLRRSPPRTDGHAIVRDIGAPPEKPSTQERLDGVRTALREMVEHLPRPTGIVATDSRAYPIPRFDIDASCISVVVPLFNEERFVSDAIVSLKRQTVRNFEVLVVDDASTDDSARVAIRAIGSDPRFRLIRHLRNSGLSASRNTGLRLAGAPYVTFLDADDILLPDALEIRLARFGEETDDRLAGVYCGVSPAAEWITADYVPAKRSFEGRRHTFVSAEGECPFNAHAPILRTDVLRRLSGFDETLRSGGEDWDLWQRVMRHGYWFEPVNRVAAVYRRKSGSMVRTLPLEHVRAGQRIMKWAHSPLSPEEVVPGTPFVFTESVADYRSEVSQLKRMIHFGAMAYMRDRDLFREFLPNIRGELWPYAMQDVNIKQVVNEAIIRYLAIDASEGRAIGSDVALVRDAIIAHYLDAAENAVKNADIAPPNVGPDVVLFASNAKQARLMLELHAGLAKAGRSSVLVSAEAVTGDQGVEAVWVALGQAYLSYNAYVLNPRTATRLRVVMRPYDAALRDIAAEGDGVVMELVDPDAPIDLPDENLPLDADFVVTPGEALTKLAELLSSIGDKPDLPTTVVSSQVETPARIGTTASFILDKEERLDLPPDYERLRAFKDRYRGERCFIIGNGPSLNTLDLTRLKDEHTFAVNSIFYKADEMGFDPTFYVVEDSSVMRENIEAIRAYRAKHKFFPTVYRDLHPAESNVQFFLMNRGFYEREGAFFCVPRFSVDAARRVFCGQSVTHINLQLAYYFGFSKVYLIGMDFSYRIPESAIVNGDLIRSVEDDPNHFHPLYFGAGKSWKNPKLERVKMNYQVARDIFAADNREIVNATNGGELGVFRREMYDSLF